MERRTLDDSLHCPRCLGRDVRRSQHQGVIDLFMETFHRWAFRCRNCRKRFYVYLASEQNEVEARMRQPSLLVQTGEKVRALDCFPLLGSGAANREAREKRHEAARRREIDIVLVRRLDRWGRSVTDLLATLQELGHLGVGFVSLTEALDLTTPAGRAMAGLLAVFADLKGRFCGSELGLAWPMRGRTGNSWSAGNRGRSRCGNPEAASCWC